MDSTNSSDGKGSTMRDASAEKQVHRQKDDQIVSHLEGHVDGRVDSHVDGRVDSHVDGQADGATASTARRQSAIDALEHTRPPKQSKAAKKAAKGGDRRAFEEVNVLVTGFGLFDDFRDSNPSWLIARSLPPMLPVNAAHPSRIRIIVHPIPVPVSYKAIHELTSNVYGVTGPVHLCLHIGVGEKRDYYSVEKIGLRDGYTTEDADGKLPPGGQPAYWSTGQGRLETTAALNDVVARWKGEVPGQDLRISEDAGRYICEYQLYASLAYWAEKKPLSLPWQERTMVTFMHVPKSTDQKSVDKGREIAIGLIYALIDSRRSRDGDYEEDGTHKDPSPEGSPTG